MKNIWILGILLCGYFYAEAQNKISGIVTNEKHQPLFGASVYIPDMDKGSITLEDGSYEFTNLPNGKIKIQFSMVGYANRIETKILDGKSIQLDIALQPSSMELEEIVVTGGYSSSQHNNAVKINNLKLNPRNIEQSPNLTEMATKIPGVDMISKGSGVMKPVIRGLSMNNILVLNNGVRFENYQYSSHHPLGIEEYGIENIEVIKGPASLLYGSDAIGGVINFIKEKPAPVGEIKADYHLKMFSNTNGLMQNMGIKGTGKKFYGGIRAGHASHADFLQGGGAFAPNSRFNTWSVKGNAGFTDKIGVFRLFYEYNNQKLGMVEDEAIDEVTSRGRENNIWYQAFNTHLISSQNKLYLGGAKLDVDAAFQSTELNHIGNQNSETQMQLSTLSYNAKLHFPSTKKSEYIIGFQGYNQTNQNLNNRESILLPNAITQNYSLYGLLQYTFFEHLKVQTGLRYDYKNINSTRVGTDSTIFSYRHALDKNYGSFSGSLGMVFRVSDALLFRANFASAFRTPNLAELTSNGVHEIRYELGSQNLVPEKTLEGDLSLHYHNPNLSFDLAGFYNKINNYIFIANTGDTVQGGMFIYQYQQANSYLYGGEIGLHIHPKAIKLLHFETSFASVIGKQVSGSYLPFIPAHKLKVELRLEKERIGRIKEPYFAINSHTAFAQNNIFPGEDKTPGYSLLGVKLGGSFYIKSQVIHLILSASNLLDTQYRDHLSTLNEVGILNPGRDISLSINIPIDIK